MQILSAFLQTFQRNVWCTIVIQYTGTTNYYKEILDDVRHYHSEWNPFTEDPGFLQAANNATL